MSLTLEQTAELHELLWGLRAGTASPDELARLEQWVCDDPEVRAFYVRYMHLCADLHWNNEEAAGDSSSEVGGEVRGEEREFSESQIPIPPSSIPVSSPYVVLDTSDLSAPLFAVHPVLLSNCIAVVVMCVGLLGAWIYQIDVPQSIAQNGLPGMKQGSGVVSRPSTNSSEYIGRITDMVGVTWSDPTTAAVTDRVALGRKYALASGLMEITYDAGAKVILQGPCTFQAVSRNGGFLAVGKLTARLEKRGEGENYRSEITNQKSPQSTIHDPLFTIKTPTALVTDLGTEFGVEVDRQGNTNSHVFRGKVEVSLLTVGGEKLNSVQLVENQSVRVELGKGIQSPQRVASTNATAFARMMPNRVPIKLFNTGVGLSVSGADPHWQAVAISDALNFQPHPAQVISLDAWLENDPHKSQWITFKGENPNNAEYTFRTTFDLTGMYPRTAYVDAWFLADNRVSAVRINGKNVKVYPHGWNNFTMFSRFQVTSGFVEGINTLEIDVHNGEPMEGDGPGLMGLRVELSGTAREKETVQQ